MKYRHEGLMLLVQYPEYAKRWIGGVVSGFGSQVGWIALIWLVMQLSGSAASIGIVTLLYQLPQAIVAPVAGVVLDRYPRARVMSAANFALAAAFACIPLVAMSLGKNGLWLIYVLITLAGIAVPFDTTGSAPLIAELIPNSRLSEANFLTQTIWQIASLVGPGLGGVLIAVIGSRMLIFVDAATFLFLGVLMWTISTEGDMNPTVHGRPVQKLKQGIVYLFKSPPLVALAILSVLFYLFYGPYEVLLPAMAKASPGGSAALGLLWFSFAVGALSGGLLFSAKSWKYRLSISMAAIIVLWGIVTIAIAYATHDLWGASLLMLLGGLVYAPWGALVSTARQRIVPRELQGRVFGASAMITAGGTPVGAWMTGALLPFVTPHRVFLLSGIITVAVGFAGVFWPALRGVDTKSAAAPQLHP